MTSPGAAAQRPSGAVRFEGVLVRRGSRTILDIPLLEIPGGATTVIFGPNGAGKTTILRLIAGLDRPDAGTVRVGGAPRNGRGGVAYAFQEAVFLRGSVRSNLSLGLELRGVADAARRARVESVARDCGIAHLLNQDASTLSGGEAQRANLARALSLRDPITLLDEPLAGFDRLGRAHFVDELDRLLRGWGSTVILVTHDREEALRLADHVVVVVGGRARVWGPLQEVVESPPDAEVAELLGYLVLPTDGGLIGVAPAGLRLGTGAQTFGFRVDRVLRVGGEGRMVGRIATPEGGIAAEVLLPEDVPRPRLGETVAVSANAWVSLPGA